MSRSDYNEPFNKQLYFGMNGRMRGFEE